MNKIFGIGFQKTATSSLGAALELLGYRIHGYDIAHNEDEAKQKANTHLEEFDGLQDFPWPILYRWLDEQYPRSKFILTVRDEDEWIQSVCRHIRRSEFSNQIHKMHEWIYGYKYPINNESAYVEIYKKHNEEVKKYFSNRRGDDFIVMDITGGDGWDKLTSFLEIGQPLMPFPKYMVSEKKRKKMSKIEYARWRMTYSTSQFMKYYNQGRVCEKVIDKIYENLNIEK